MKRDIRRFAALGVLTAILAAASMPSMAQNTHTLPYVLPASNAALTGFVRIINNSDQAGTVSITATDDTGRRFDPITLNLQSGQTVNFNSRDLENGNAAKGLSGGVGDGSGSWRLLLQTALNITPLAYIRTSDGFVTGMYDVAPGTGAGSSDYRIVFFNPGSNDRQVSRLRLINPGTSPAEIEITGRDDAGMAATGGAIRMTIPAGGASTLDAQTLESGGEGITGSFGDGTGKWQLTVSSNVDIQVMSLLQSPTGHLANLSTTPLHVGTPTEPATEEFTCCDFGRYTVDNVVSWNQCSCWSSDDVQSCQDATYKFLSGPVVYGTPVESCPSYRRPYGQCCFTADGGVDEGRDAFGGTPVTSDFCECWSIPEDVTGWVCENSTIGPSISIASCPPSRASNSPGQTGFRSFADILQSPSRPVPRPDFLRTIE